MSPIKVIFDTDPGVDDAMALYFALAHPGIALLGITTTFGNVHVEQAAANALYLCGLAGRQIPVAQGVAKPLVRTASQPPDFIHGADGLGNLAHRVPQTAHCDPRSAAQFIVDLARQHPGEITLVAVGPLGNLATALQLEPRLPSLVRGVVLMGGTVLEPGNVSPVAEANVWNDPDAAEQVFAAGWQVSMVGLDVTHRVVTRLSLFEMIAAHHQHAATDTLLHAVRFYANFYTGMHPHLAASPGCFAHDVLAFVYLLHPEFFTTETGCVRVVTDGLAMGQTVMNRRQAAYPQPGWEPERSRATVALQVDAPACLHEIERVLMSNWLAH